MRGLSPVVASGVHSSSRCAGLSLSRPLFFIAEHRLQMRRLSSCGSRAQSLCGMWDLPRPGLEPVSPALAGRTLNHCATREAPWVHFFKVSVQLYSFACGYQDFTSTICWEDCPFPTEWSCILVENQLPIRVRVNFYFVFYSIGLYVCPFPITTLLIYCRFIVNF